MTRPTLSPTVAGIGFYLVSMLCFSGMNTLIRTAFVEMHEVSSLQLVFVRNLCSLGVMLAIAAVMAPRARKRSTSLSLHFWRAAIGLFAMETWFHALSLMPVNQATAISFTSPLFATMFAVCFLGETAGRWSVGALVAGFLGTLVILRPTEAQPFTSDSFVALFAAAMISLASLVVKRLAGSEPPWRIVLYMSGLMSLLSAAPGLWVWQPLPPKLYLLTFGVAFCSTMAQLAMVSAFKRGSIVVLMPFDFSRLVFTALIAWIVLGERLGAHTLLGAAVIVAASAVIAWRETHKDRPEAAVPAAVE